MKKIIIFMLILLVWTVSLFAQVTREQADSIVREHLQNEMIAYSHLYVHINVPSEEGITITTSNEEIFTAKYACWAYCPDENNFIQRRYFFVKEDNGNLLEVITNNDLDFLDLNVWRLVESTGLVERNGNNIKSLYPNPTNGQWRIDNGYDIKNVEIFDVMGRIQKATINKQDGEITIDISHLPSGVYLLKITTEHGIITQKAIKN
jgi:hypothetical protein